MDSPSKNHVKGKRKLNKFLGFTDISHVSNSAIPEVGKQILAKIVSKESSDDSCVTHSGNITNDVSNNTLNDGFPPLTSVSSIAPQNKVADDHPDLNEESELVSFRRAATMLFFEGGCNCRHVVPIGSRFQAEIPLLESEYAKNKQMVGMPRMSGNRDKGKVRRVNKAEKFPDGRWNVPYQQGGMI